MSVGVFRMHQIPKAFGDVVTFQDTIGTYVHIDKKIVLDKYIQVAIENDICTAYLRYHLKGPSKDVLVIIQPYNAEETAFPELVVSALESQLSSL